MMGWVVLIAFGWCSALGASIVCSSDEAVRTKFYLSDPAQLQDGRVAREAAATSMCDSLGIADPAVRSLIAAWLAANPAVMETRESTSRGEFLATCPDAGSVKQCISRLAAQVETYGAPIVIIEAQRPANTNDTLAASEFQTVLANAGMRAIVGSDARSRRRELADAAVERGMNPDEGRSAIDRLDADFVIRVEHAQVEREETQAYGVKLVACQVTLTLSFVRAADQSSIPLAPVTIALRSRDATGVEQAARSRAAADAATRVIALISEEWVSVSEGKRDWILEISPSAEFQSSELMHAAQVGEVVVLENRPGIRALLAVPPEGIDRLLASGKFGVVIHKRPGYLLLDSAPSQPSRINRFAGGAIALIGGVILWYCLRKRRLARATLVDTR
ncbi:MAG: hypothetical protein EXS01_05055 [Phycisphaerales bacterium]|nr:hypothetical protein [Phycisphaerales bacterium]